MAKRNIPVGLFYASYNSDCTYELNSRSGSQYRPETVSQYRAQIRSVATPPNRVKIIQWLPRAAVQSLQDFAETGEAKRLYERFCGRKDVVNRPPANRLLYVPSHPAREIDKDLETAGIPKHAPGGKLDFHACRVAYINLVLESSNVTVKEAQALARHATSELTMNVYGRVRNERLSEVVEDVGKTLLQEQKCVPSVYRRAVGAETESATSIKNEALRSDEEWWRRRELNPTQTSSSPDISNTDPGHFRTISTHNKELGDSADQPAGQNRTLPGQKRNISEHNKCALNVHPDLPTDLAEIAGVWDRLSKPLKAAIIAMVREAARK